MQGGKIVAVKLGQLDRSLLTLKDLMQARLPFKASYWLRRNIESIRRVYMPFAEAKHGLFLKCAVIEDGKVKIAADGMNIELREDMKETFWSEYNELASKAVDVEVYPLKVDWFDKVEGTVDDLTSIDFMLEE